MKARLEKVLARRPIRAWRYETPAFRVPFHFHPEAELILIESGRGHRLVGDALCEFGPGDLVFLAGDLPHSYHSLPPPSGGNGKAAVIQFRWAQLLDWSSWDHELHYLERLHEEAVTGLCFGSAASESIGPLFQRVIAASSLAQLTALFELLEGLAALGTRQPIASPLTRLEPDQTHLERLDLVTDHLFTHYREPVTLTEVAQLAHMTPAAFSRFFRRHTHRSFVRFVNELRIGHAARLLIETDRTVLDIANDSGFRNLANFNRRFREIEHCNPSEFRKRTRGE